MRNDQRKNILFRAKKNPRLELPISFSVSIPCTLLLLKRCDVKRLIFSEFGYLLYPKK